MHVTAEILFVVQDAGVTLEIDGHDYNFHGTLTVVPADNLASQYLGGYKSLSAALHKVQALHGSGCRYAAAGTYTHNHNNHYVVKLFA